MGTSNGQRQDLWLITVTIDGVPVPGNFDKRDGGEADTSETKYRPGGSPDEVSLGGPRNIGNVTIGRLFVRERDLSLCKRYVNRVGKASVVVSQTALDEDNVASGEPFIWTGKLKRCTLPTADANSQGASMFELEISTSSVA